MMRGFVAAVRIVPCNQGALVAGAWGRCLFFHNIIVRSVMIPIFRDNFMVA